MRCCTHEESQHVVEFWEVVGVGQLVAALCSGFTVNAVEFLDDLVLKLVI